MNQYIGIIAITILGGLAVTGTLFPAVEALADVIAATLAGEPLNSDIGAKFVSPDMF